MRKSIEEMTDHEMLTELLREKRREENWRYVKLGVYALIIVAIAILCAIYLPPVIAYFRRLNESIQQIQQALQQLQNTTDSVKSTVAELGESGAEALHSAVDKLNELLEKVSRIFR